MASTGEREARRVELLAQIASEIAHSRDLDAALGAALHAILDSLALPVGGIYLLDEESGDLIATSHRRGVPPGYAEAVARFHPGEALLGRALEGDAPMVVPDLSQTAGARDATRKLGLRSVVFVPLYARRRAVGVMPLGGFELREFEADDLRLLAAVGGILGLAVDDERLAERARRDLAQAEALAVVDRAMQEDRPLDEVVGVVAREAARLAGGEAAILLLEDEAKPRLARATSERLRGRLGDRPALPETLLAELARGGPPVALPGSGAAEQGLVIRLPAGVRLLGALVVTRPRPEWSRDERALLAAFGVRAAAALTKARAREAESRRASQLALLSAASEIAASTLDVARLLSSLARYVQRALDYYSVAVYLVEPESRSCRLEGAAGAAALAMPMAHRMPFGYGIIGWVAENGQHVLANDVRREPRFVPAPLQATLSELAVPVRLMGEVVAVINVESDRLDAFDEGDVVALDGIASHVASAIRNAGLFEEKVRALRNLEILQEITNVLNSDLELDALLSRIARRSVEAIHPAQMGAVLLLDDDALVVRSSFGYSKPEALARVRLAYHAGLPGSVFVSGHGRAVRCTPQDFGGHAAAFHDAGGNRQGGGALCVPVALPQEKLGTLLLESGTSPEAFDAADLRFATTLAHQAAIAIGNALRLRRILEMDRQRREYLSNVSHELRSPLTVVQGYIEAVANEVQAGAAAQYARVAEQNCHRLGRMIDEVLEVSRFEQGVARRHLEWAPVQLGELLRRVVRALQPEARLKGVELCEHTAEGVPVLAGDERLLQLLVHNLAENAVKFTPRGGRVDLRLDAEDDWLLLRVRDDGIGIAREHHERIFEKFFTVEGGSSRSYGGAGIGLFLAREVMNIHEGALEVASSPGAGSCFVARFPLRPGAGGPVERPL